MVIDVNGKLRATVGHALDMCDGSRRYAAKDLGISIRLLHILIRELGLLKEFPPTYKKQRPIYPRGES